MIEILGRPADLSLNLTVDQAADFIKKEFPDVWKIVYTKHIDCPGNYYNFKAPAVTLAAAIIQNVMRRPHKAGGSIPIVNTALAASVLQKYNYPTYYVSAPLLEALQHTHPPTQMRWSEVFFPYDAMIFMLPRGFLHEQPSREPINFVGIARLKKDHLALLPLRPGDQNTNVTEDRIVVFWSVKAGLELQDCMFPVTQPLEPSPGWIDQKTEQYREISSYPWDAPPSDFSSYVAGLVANFILIMSARKELVEHGERTGRFLRNNVPIHTPNFIGKKYEIIRRTPTAATGAHFTELDWRSGYIRVQHYGPRNSLTTLKLIDPYIAFVRGLKKDEPQTEVAQEQK